MRRRRPLASRVLILLAMVVAAGATLLLREHLARLEARAAETGPGQPTLAVTADLARGAVLEASMLEVRGVPEPFRPPGALSHPGEAIGRTLAADVVAGEALTRARLAPEGGPVAALVPPGLRAVPVTASLPAGTVAPGDRVDVLATYPAGRAYAETVVQAAEVLLVLDARAPEDLGTATTVVLLVAPDAAERLAYARAFADLSVSVAPPPSAPVLPGGPW